MDTYFTNDELSGKGNRLQRSLRGIFWLILLALLTGAGGHRASAQTASARPVAVVSAASYAQEVAPGSIGSLFGSDFSTDIVPGERGVDGSLPVQLAGVTVTMGGKAVPLFYVSPNQVNFLVPSDQALGLVPVVVTGRGGQVWQGSVKVQLTAPGLFLAQCLRPDRVAAQNGVTFLSEPFRAVTEQNPSDDKRTRITLYATGVRYSGSQTRQEANVAARVQVKVTLDGLNQMLLPAEYAGAAPGFAGLDQINVILPAALDQAGVLKVCVVVDGKTSNCGTILTGQRLPDAQAGEGYWLTRVAGDGLRGYAGDLGPAVKARLSSPSAVAVDRDGTVYVADSGNRLIRKITTAGTITVFAGRGSEGSSGDEGPAVKATFRRLVSLALDHNHNLYVADADDNRVRRIDQEGVIHPFAGTGAAGFAGDGGVALQAQFHTPMSVVVDAFNNVLIADSLNHRVRKVTADGLIISIAGTGHAGFSGDGDAAYLADLNTPDSVAATRSGTVLVSDSKNLRIRKILPDGTIRTLAGTGQPGDNPDACVAALAAMRGPLRLATDRFGRLYFSDSGNHRVRVIDSNCMSWNIAGSGNEGMTTSDLPALDATLSEPLGLAVSLTGEVYFADITNHLLNKLIPGGGQSCGEVAELGVDPAYVSKDKGAIGFVRLKCATNQPVTVSLRSSEACVSIPATVTIPPGEVSATFPVTEISQCGNGTTTITATEGKNTLETEVTIVPPGGPGVNGGLSITVSKTSVVGGLWLTGRVTLSTPAPDGGVNVQLVSDKGEAVVAPSVHVPAGELVAEFLILTKAVTADTKATVTGTMTGIHAEATFTITGSGGPGELKAVDLGSLSVSPSSVTGGQTATGTVTLAAAAPAGGVLVNLSSNSPSATVPGSITIPAGSTSGTFAVTTTTVASSTSAVITATSANTVTANLSLTAATAGQATLGSLSVSPASVTGGQSATGTVTLAAAAPAGGVLVNLSSNSASATVPASITIPAGSTSGTFAVTTTTVASATYAVITATSANTVTANLSINAPCVQGLTLSVGTILGGQGLTGTVTLTGPAPAGGAAISLLSSNLALAAPATVLVPAGQTSATFNLTTAPVATILASTLQALFGPCGGVTANLQINAPILQTLGISPSSLPLLATATGTVTLNGPAPAGGLTIGLAANSPLANLSLSLPVSVTVPGGATSATFSVQPLLSLGLLLSNAQATVTATLNGTNLTSSVTVTPASGNVAGVSIAPSTVTGGSGATGTVTLATAAPQGGLVVTLASDSPSVTVPASITIAAGATSGTFAVSTTAVSNAVTAHVSATSANSVAGVLTVAPPCVNGLNLSVNSILGGNGLTGTVTLTGPAPAGGASVQLVSANAAVSLPASILVPAGATSATFSIATSPVALLLNSTIQALFGPCGGVTVTLQVNAPILQALNLNPASLKLLATGTGTVTLNGAAPAGGLTVNLSSNSLLSNLLIQMPSTVTIPEGATSANFSVKPLLSLGVLLSATQSTITATLNSVSLGSILNVLPLL